MWKKRDTYFYIYFMKKCKWCEKEIVDMRLHAVFCRRACKNMYRRSIKNENNKNGKKM